MAGHQPVTTISRRGFLSAALVGLAPKSGRRIEGGFVHESHDIGHRIRDRVRFGEPRETRRLPIVIVGGGIAGLSAAWRLDKRGIHDYVVLEMDAVAGGNARSGENAVTAFPWAAHYVPVPGRAAGLVRELFADLGVFDGQAWDERHLVHAPKERLFIHGRWQEGLEPLVGPTRRDRDQIARFAEKTRALAESGRFTVPSAFGLEKDSAPSEDAPSMAAWLDREGLDSRWLRWMVDYACRDDYGAMSADVSAWAGLHYFAGREDDDGGGPLTWPEGNGWIVRRMLERIGTRIRTSSVVSRITRQGKSWRVVTSDVAWVADAVILATPWLVTSRIVDDVPRADVTYSPWLTANLTLDRWPAERSLPPAWDNVIFDSPGLGYVVATHQLLRRHVPQTVWTYYWALAELPPAAARRWLLAASWSEVKDRILADLSRPHPDIADCVSRVDIWRMGHAMVRPTPGFLASPLRRRAPARVDGLAFAHSDVAGLPLFEEAHAQGVAAAESVSRRVLGSA